MNDRLHAAFDRIDRKIAVLTLLVGIQLGIQVALSLTTLALRFLIDARLP